MYVIIHLSNKIKETKRVERSIYLLRDSSFDLMDPCVL